MEEKVQKDNKKVGGIVVSIILIIAAFVSGYFLSKALSGEEKAEDCPPVEEKKEEKKEDQPAEEPAEEPVEQPVKNDIPIMDNIVVNLYGGGYVYFIADGYAYYLQADLLDDGRWFLLTHSDCLRDGNSDYCKGNPVYGRKAVKVEGVDSVLRLKLTHKPGATDESFATFAIDATGNIYQLNGNKATKYYGNNDVEDMISENEVILKDGTHKNIK